MQLVTGRSVEEWTQGPTISVDVPSVDVAKCSIANSSIESSPDKSPSRTEIIKPWGVEVVGGPTPAKALARYHEWQPKYAAILGDRAPHVVVRGIIGQMGAARVRVGEDTRGGAAKLCAALRAAGTYCDVMRN